MPSRATSCSVDEVRARLTIATALGGRIFNASVSVATSVPAEFIHHQREGSPVTDLPDLSNPVLPSGLVLPRGVRIIDPTALEPPAPVGPPCAKCGLPLPPMDDDTLRVLRASGGLATIAHEVCPGETPPPVTDRHFELRVRIVEIEMRDTGGLGRGPNPEPVVTEMMAATVTHRAATLDQAMRPLAEKFGEKWLQLEKQALIADDPATGIPTVPLAGSPNNPMQHW